MHPRSAQKRCRRRMTSWNVDALGQAVDVDTRTPALALPFPALAPDDDARFADAFADLAEDFALFADDFAALPDFFAAFATGFFLAGFDSLAFFFAAMLGYLFA